MMMGQWLCGVALMMAMVTVTHVGAVRPPAARPAAVERMPASAAFVSPRVAISGDGRVLAFESLARLTADDDNAARDIYALDRETGALTRASAPQVATPRVLGDSGRPQLSGDGRFLIFASPGDLTGDAAPTRFPNVFLRDRARGTLRCLSCGPAGQAPDGVSEDAAISADGRTVAFTSRATNLVAGVDPNAAEADVYLWRAETAALSRPSLEGIGARVKGAFEPSLSADGERIAFTVTLEQVETPDGAMMKRGVASRLVTRIFVLDLRTGALTRVGCATETGCPDGRDFQPSLSADGRFVAFASTASDRVPRDENGRADVFLFELETRRTMLISRTPSGRPGNAASSFATLSGDGRFVAFESRASDLACDRPCGEAQADRNLVSDVFLFDRATGVVTRLSGGDEPWWDASVAPAIDAAGQVVAFSSAHASGPEDWLGDFDLYLWASGAASFVPPPQPTS